ncbi:MAG: TetR/AcrR family transcriptional regulator [Chloroflexota bacterium]|jgi:AcrR family transcriptional regulator
MTTETRRPTLTRDRVLTGAIELVDEIGIEAFTIRRLAAALDSKPMTIYHYVESKDEIIDGMVDVVFAEIELPATDIDWREAMRRRCRSAREVLVRHPWAPPLMESRQDPGPATLRHHDAVLGCLRRAGLSLALTAHAYAIVDSYVYGFALEEANLPGAGGAEMVEMAATMFDERSADYPHLAEFTTEHVLQPDYRFADSFDFGLDLILDGLARAASSDERARATPSVEPKT